MTSAPRINVSEIMQSEVNEWTLRMILQEYEPSDEEYGELRSALVADCGEETTNELFRRAHALLDEDNVTNGAMYDFATSLNRAQVALREALAALQVIQRPEGWSDEYKSEEDWGSGEDFIAHLKTALLHTNAADSINSQLLPGDIKRAVLTGGERPVLHHRRPRSPSGPDRAS